MLRGALLLRNYRVFSNTTPEAYRPNGGVGVIDCHIGPKTASLVELLILWAPLWIKVLEPLMKRMQPG